MEGIEKASIFTSVLLVRSELLPGNTADLKRAYGPSESSELLLKRNLSCRSIITANANGPCTHKYIMTSNKSSGDMSTFDLDLPKVSKGRCILLL